MGRYNGSYKNPYYPSGVFIARAGCGFSLLIFLFHARWSWGVLMARYVVEGDGYDGYYLTPFREDVLHIGSSLVVELSPEEFEDFSRSMVAYWGWQERLQGVADDLSNLVPGVPADAVTDLVFERLPRKSRS